MSRRPLLLISLAVLCAGAIAGCGGKESNLLSSQQSDQLTAKIDAAEKAMGRQDCAAAHTQLDEAIRNIDALPSSVDSRLISNLRQWATHLRTKIGTDCQSQTEPIQPEEPLPTTPTPKPENEEKPTEPAKPQQPQQQPKPNTEPTQPSQTNPQPKPKAKPKPRPQPPAPPAPTGPDGGAPAEG